VSKDPDALKTPNYWLWVLIVTLVGLLLVPVVTMSMAIKKTGWKSINRVVKDAIAPAPLVSTDAAAANQSEVSPEMKKSLDLLRSTVERAALNVIHLPTLKPRIHEVMIQRAESKLKKTSNSVHLVLDQKNIQYVEAFEPGKIRLILLIKSKDWPLLSGKLQLAAENDGFSYHGPSETVTGNQSDDMIAEIEIRKKAQQFPQGRP
jgi:hypothetical protein